LPRKQGVDVLQRIPKLQEFGKEYVQGLPEIQRKKKEFVVLLDLIHEARGQ
jgi:hypothetical protein